MSSCQAGGRQYFRAAEPTLCKVNTRYHLFSSHVVTCYHHLLESSTQFASHCHYLHVNWCWFDSKISCTRKSDDTFTCCILPCKSLSGSEFVGVFVFLLRSGITLVYLLLCVGTALTWQGIIYIWFSFDEKTGIVLWWKNGEWMSDNGDWTKWAKWSQRKIREIIETSLQSCLALTTM
jgi:hypothetical protein